jgi:hypothetical protein
MSEMHDIDFVCNKCLLGRLIGSSTSMHFKYRERIVNFRMKYDAE